MDYPREIVRTGHVEPCPRRVRGLLGGTVVFDTTNASYVWEWPHYPRYYIPLADVRPDTAAAYTETELAGMVRFDWAALDAWFEEDEEIFVHPRDPYTRVDALRSTRRVRVELDGVVLADCSSPVMVFETGLPPRYYLNRTEIDFTHLEPSDTVTACPYKGRTSGYWSVRVNGTTYPDLAWTYDFPTRQLLPIAGLIAFYNEKVDTYLDGELVPRPATHFS
jgi:uncharacterized protein (DUF427 family)